jgi:hypothetical protein
MYWQRGNSNVYKGDFQNSNSTDLASRWFWTQPTNAAFATDNGRDHYSYDGKRYQYYNNDSSFARWDVVEGTHETLASGLNTMDGHAYAIDSSTGNEHIFYVTGTGTSGLQFRRYDIATNSHVTRSNTSWNTNSSEGAGTWNGRDTMYFFRGNTSTSWGYYDIPTDNWTAGTTTGLASFRGGSVIYVPASSENGLTNDRLYVWRGTGTGTFYSIDILSSGVPTGTWATRASSPLGNMENGDLFYFGGDYIFGCTPIDTVDREVLRYQISTNTWTRVDIFGFPIVADARTGGNISYHQTHVPVDDEGSTTDFWFFGSADRLAIVTKGVNSEYDFVYAGLISSYYDRTFATLSAGISAGADVVVSVDDGSIFTEGQLVILSDQTNATGDLFQQVGTDQKTRLFLNGEQASIKSVNGNNITLVNVQYNYPAGSRMGIDIQPVGVTAFRSNRMMMLNHLPQSFPDGATRTTISGPAATYKWACTSTSELTAQSAEESRTGQYMLWPIAIARNWNHAKQEVRGQFNGVFIVDDAGTAVAEDLITFLGENYMLFQFDNDFYNEDRLFAFGPV